MAKREHKPKPSELIDEYIDNAEKFAKPICKKIREIILNSDPGIVEDWKWGPNYQKNGMICGFGAFRNHVTFVFFKGSLLSDPQKILLEGGSNVHNRSVKFKSVEEVDEKILTKYIKQAVKVNLAGLKPEKPQLEIPLVVSSILMKDNKLKNAFNNLTYTEKKECIISIRDAKKEETRKRRIDRIIDNLNSRKGKY